MITAAKAVKPDTVGALAVDAARAALLDLVDDADVGEHLGLHADGERVVTHSFVCLRAGYRGWRWAVTVVRASRAKTVTVDEVVLLPGDDSITAPEWLPYRDRIQPGDLSPGDLLPTEEDDARLVPAYLTGDPGDEIVDQDSIASLVDELGLGLGRTRVLSLEGRDLAAERWYDGSHGPESPLAKAAPATCASCGFLVRLAGPLSQLFGVCANAQANDDGRVVSWDHGCGAHSEAQLAKNSQPQPLPDPVMDTLSWDELEQF
ncbi:MAG: DUF3027 domain-containing protein [Nocardioidaceae bacterium]